MATQPTQPKPRPIPPGLAPGLGGDPSRAAGGGPTGSGDFRGAGVGDVGWAAAATDYAARAILLWPGLDRGRLSLARGDPERIARLVARRTSLPPETILRMLGVRSAPRPDVGAPPADV